MRFYWPILCLQFILSALSFRASLSSSSSSSSTSVPYLCSHTQSSALILFKTQFSINETASKDCEYPHIKSYPKTNSWKKGLDCCLWDGVTCDNITGQVIGLDLSCSWLSGTFPSNSRLFHLSHLQKLDLSFNDFSKSRISPSFGGFPSLTHLDLTSSWFSGPVPYEISYLSKLVSLYLSYRPILDIVSGIEAPGPTLKLETCTLNGIVRNLTKVREVYLDGIDMSSVDPNSFMNLSASLTSLSLGGCHLRGSFPDNLFNLPNIQSLTLDENPNLTGQFPKSNWTSPLEVLDASITSLSGELPESLGNLKSLRGLGLVGCNLWGPIPASLGNLSQLSFLFLSWNHFSGEIPSSVTNLTQLGLLVLASNQLEGPVPDNLNAFPNLGFVDLSHNLLSGRTPSWFYTNPTVLELGNNQFTGHIDEFQNRCLEILSLNNNSFRGPIPSSISQLVNLTILDLSSNELKGTISLDMFSELQNLQQLDLSSNALLLCSNNTVSYVLPNLQFVNLSSNILHEFPKFLLGSKKLESLDLHSNFIEGDLPISMSELVSLRFLCLSSNFIEGDLPVLPPNIRFLSVSNNSLSGKISDVCNAKSLEILDLSRNKLSGAIPQCIGSFSRSLTSLNLKMNKLHGTIPPTFAKGCALENLNLNSNHLEGPLTRSITNCKHLQVVDLGNNKINGTFPHWIHALPELQVLVLRSNKFQGPIHSPKSPRPLPKLRIVDLSHNNFFGPLPTSYIQNFKGMMNIVDDGKAATYMGERSYSYDYSVSMAFKGLEVELVKILTIFTSLDLSSNNFEGEIPRVIGELGSLIGLNLSHNNLCGRIPPSLRNLAQLEWLDLSSNKLGGQIPMELLDLTFLSSFNVSYNQLVGPIPQGRQFNTFENGSYLGNEGLCGVPLSRGCNNESQPEPWMKANKEEGSKLEFGWKVVAIGYGFGFVFGVGMGYVFLRTGKPKWFVTLFEARRRRR
ncbi:hypothetical protein V6N11_042693 [Hibiscus sabdariffa]|uniref:Leucine-rich repeat-containing N-terminal plant-type domain-containing protein n=1 Tax=Hibiscus sabdariffa TaxID=183260 RepID=A0ABR2QX35_9ROSI